MASIMRVLGGMVPLAAGYVAWINHMAHRVPEEDRGSLLSRTVETTTAVFKTILDRHVSKNHISLVASLPSKEAVIKCSRASSHEKINESCREILHFLDESRTSPLVFRCAKMPFYYEKESQGFVFCGTMEKLHDPRVREQILEGRYVICSSFSSKGHEGRVIVGGTINHKKCPVFKKGFGKKIVPVNERFLALITDPSVRSALKHSGR